MFGARRNGKPILVLGGTGKTGRRVAARLKARGLPVRIGSRTGEAPFDWEQPEGWERALKGVGSVYVSYQPDLAAPGSDKALKELVRQATRAGVRRLVLLSGRGEPEAQVCEEIVRGSTLEWSIVRASWFAQNFSENFMAEGVMAGEVALPAGAIAEPFIDVEDIADIAVAALIENTHVGKLYEVTGPRLLTFAEAIAEIAWASGREVRFREISMDEFKAGLRAAQTPEDLVDLLAYLFGTVLDGRNARVEGGVERALGRVPRDFADYARAAAASGAWGAPAR